jgi:hypothetical protein
MMNVVAVSQRHEAVEAGDHLVPVEQHVEGDDRRDDDQRHEIDQRLPLRPQRADETGENLSALPDEIGDRLLHLLRVEAVAKTEPVENAGIKDAAHLAGCELLQLDDIVRQRRDEGGKLVTKHRRQKNERQREEQDEERQNEQRRRQTAQAPFFQLVGDGIEQIAERDRRRERQQHAAQHIKQKRDAGRQRRPKPEMPFRPHVRRTVMSWCRASPSRPGEAQASYHGISTAAPVVARPSSSVCARAASASGKCAWTGTFTAPLPTTSISSAAISVSTARSAIWVNKVGRVA